MTTKVESIVIVGGGSAGWMSAATICSRFPNRKVTVVESPNVPVVGVGESTIGGIRLWCQLIGLDEDDFMQFTDASYKLSIRFTDFYRKGSGSFHYPFGSAFLNGGYNTQEEWFIKKYLYQKTPVEDYANSYFSQMALVNNNRFTKNENNEFPGYNFKVDSAFHFDATKFGIWLRDRFCKPRGVSHIQAEVASISADETGIKELELDNGQRIKADLFVDCTGFKSLLLDKTIKEPFISYSDILPNDSAWATQVQYNDKQKELVTYTDCHAIDNGWVWNIPLWSRIGTGYVYSSKYVSDENALVEFKQHLTSKGIESDSLKYKNIKMRVGIHKRLWVKNVVAIGLSAGFIEPLESNGLFSVHEFLIKLVRALSNDYVNQTDKDMFNYACRNQFHGFAEFVSMHYALSHRDDTQYWIDNGNRTYSKQFDNFEKEFSSVYQTTTLTFADTKYRRFTTNPNEGMNCIAVGMNNFHWDTHKIDYYDIIRQSSDWKLYANISINKNEEYKLKWNQMAVQHPTLTDYLQEKYRNDKSHKT